MTDKLTFIKEAGFEQVPSGTKRKMALYKCFCGKLKRMCIYNVKSGVSKSCGCVGIEKLRKMGLLKGRNKGSFRHGMFGTRFYNTYYSIQKRCNNEKDISYRFYGERGIKNEWADFQDFYKDMFESYRKHVKLFGERQTTLDRLDPNKNYCKSNCRWATYPEQGKNRRNNVLLEINGETKHLSEWSRVLDKSHFLVKKMGKIITKAPL
jgi:hypothetical protein